MNELNYNITAYRVPFTESQNFFFDHEPPYTEVIASWTGVNPFNIGINAFLKLPVGSALEFSQKPNYVKAEAYEGTTLKRVYYFYVNNAGWKSNITLELNMTLDVLNTFKGDFIPAFSGKTIIKRQHESRFDLTDHEPTFGVNFLMRKIDKVSEGITPKLYDVAHHNIAKSPFGNFYLIYKTSEELSESNLNNPIKCYLVADRGIPTAEPAVDIITWTLNDAPQNGFYYMSGNISVVVRGSTEYHFTPTGTGGNLANFLILHWNNGVLKVYPMNGNVANDDFQASSPFPLVTIDFNGHNDYYVSFWAASVNYSPSVFTTSTTKASSFPFAFSSGEPYGPASLPFSSVKRDESKIMKIIKLPYAPKEITKISNHYEIEGFTFDENLGFFVLNDVPSATFGEQIAEEELRDVFEETIELDNAFAGDPRHIKDPKLYHSETYNFKLNYDNFSMVIPFENCAGHPSGDLSITISFKPTNTINSKFLFSVRENGFAWQKVADYENYLLVARNNEVTLYNNDYLNYLRNGYNYDKKTKAVQDTTSVISTALAVGGGVGAVVGGIASSNPLAVAAGVATIAGAFTSSISSAINRETSFSSKIAGLQAQASGVSGVDDIDLFDEYGNNALRVSVWKPSPLIEKYLDDLYYYYGYARNYAGVPDLESRLHFNFLECDAHFDDIAAFEEYVGAIKRKLAEGVTYFHLANGYDLKQEYENYEVGLIPA